MEETIWFQKYRILKLLGRGGSAEVYLAEHLKLKSLRAIKKIGKDNILHQQLLSEAYILKSLSHPCIPVIYDFEEDARYSYIIEQYIEGDSLKVYRQRHKSLPEGSIIDFAIQICDLMNYLHSLDNPIFYLDLKPDNIILAGNKIMLIDFGASSFKNQLGERKFILGTKGYAAPELYGNLLPDERTEVYGVGTLLYFMVTGKNCGLSAGPWNRTEWKNCYSIELYRTVKKCLRSYPPLRYSKISVLRKCLSDLKHRGFQALWAANNPLSFAVAGTQHRIGTTHLAILITSVFNQKGRKGLYIERNDSRHVQAILKGYPDSDTGNGIKKLYGCFMLPEYHTCTLDRRNYPVTVTDYGCLSEKNLSEFLGADIRILVAGAKEWELKEAEVALRLLEGEAGIKYLFNYLDGSQFLKVRKNMGKLSCYRIPYIPNPFEEPKNSYLKEFVENLLL